MLNSRKRLWILFLTLVGAGSFSLVSDLEINPLLKGYGLLFVLQVSIAATYLLLFRGLLRRTGNRSSQ